MKNLIIGPLLIFLGILSIFLSFMYNDDYLQTVATVVENEKKGEVYIPILNYKVNDINYEVKGEPSEIEPEISSEVIISYNLNNPENIIIGKFDDSLMFILIGMLVFACGIYIFFSSIKYLNFDADDSVYLEEKKDETKLKEKSSNKKSKTTKKKKTKDKYEEIEILTL